MGTCPRCRSTNYTTDHHGHYMSAREIGRPAGAKGYDATWINHTCNACGHTFVSPALTLEQEQANTARADRIAAWRQYNPLMVEGYKYFVTLKGEIVFGADSVAGEYCGSIPNITPASQEEALRLIRNQLATSYVE